MDKSVITMQRMRTNDDVVYFVQFNPHREKQFAAGYGNGIIDIWDLRKTNQPKFSINAHLKNVFCLDWHPTQEGILISGSNDRFIKIWNMKEENQSPVMPPLFQIQTPQSVKKCQWVPG